MAIKVNSWDVGVKPRIVKGCNGRYSCLGGGVRAIGWTPRAAYLIWQKGRIFYLPRADPIQATSPQYRAWLDNNPFFKTY